MTDIFPLMSAESEITFHIEQLSRWLSTHTPRIDWTVSQQQAYDDRVEALMGWLAKSQRIRIPH